MGACYVGRYAHMRGPHTCCQTFVNAVMEIECEDVETKTREKMLESKEINARINYRKQYSFDSVKSAPAT